jgi:hypothetical protein
MLRTFHYAPGFDKPDQNTGPTGRSTRPVAASFRQAVTALRTTCDAWSESWGESLAACRQYEHLRSSGIPHAKAVREALGLGPIPSRTPHGAAKPLDFAGKA